MEMECTKMHNAQQSFLLFLMEQILSVTDKWLEFKLLIMLCMSRILVNFKYWQACVQSQFQILIPRLDPIKSSSVSSSAVITWWSLPLWRSAPRPPRPRSHRAPCRAAPGTLARSRGLEAGMEVETEVARLGPGSGCWRGSPKARPRACGSYFRFQNWECIFLLF